MADFVCWKMCGRDVEVPGHLCGTCAASEDRKSRRRASAAAPDRPEHLSDRSFYRHTVSENMPAEPVEARFHCESDLPPANAKPHDWAQFQAERTSTLTGGFDPASLL